jgi:type VI protein secretion system component Hcp
MKRQIIFVTLLAGALLILPAPALAQELDWFAQADQIDGCATAHPYAGWIEIDAIHHLWFRVEGQGTTPQRKEFILTRRMDCSTTDFWQALRQQTHINQFELEAVYFGEQTRVTQRYRLQDVRVESIESADDFTDHAPIERIRLSYQTFRYESECYDQSGPCGSHDYEHSFSKAKKR